MYSAFSQQFSVYFNAYRDEPYNSGKFFVLNHSCMQVKKNMDFRDKLNS